MRQRMKDLDLRITELCDYLHFSRPTMYKFIDNYEAGNTKGIDRGVLSLFRYIDENPYIGKKNVISFIINNFDFDEGSKLSKKLEKYENGKNASDVRTKFLIGVMDGFLDDEVLNYINGCREVMSKEELSDEDISYIGKYVLFRDDIINGK